MDDVVGVKSLFPGVAVEQTMQPVFRYILSLIVLICLTGGPLCVDATCSAEAEACCGLSPENTQRADDHCNDDYPKSETQDDHCANCLHCSISVIISVTILAYEIDMCPVGAQLLSVSTLPGWVSLPERPPSLV